MLYVLGFFGQQQDQKVKPCFNFGQLQELELFQAGDLKLLNSLEYDFVQASFCI